MKRRDFLSKNKSISEPDVYVIPENFIESGTVFGGEFKLRNVIEAGILSLIIGFPIFQINTSLTNRIMIACVGVIPAIIFAVVGINGESLTSFIINFFKFLFSRKLLGENKIKGIKKLKKKDIKNFKQVTETTKLQLEKINPKNRDSNILVGKRKGISKRYIKTTNEVSDSINIKKIENGIVYTKDGRYIKIIEVEPINFLLRNSREQNNIISSFISYLKVSPVKLQFKVLSKKADMKSHINKIKENKDINESAIELQEAYIGLIKSIGQKEAVKRNFYIIFQYESVGYTLKNEEIEKDAISQLSTAVRNAENFLRQCGNKVITPINENEFLLDIFYQIFNRKKSFKYSLDEHIMEYVEKYNSEHTENLTNINKIPITDLIAPTNIDFTSGKYVLIDGVYYAYLTIPREGYRQHVLAGWTSLLINAGEGIDIDMFLFREPKEKIQRKLGQQIRINRSKIKETHDTNEDFDNLYDSIKSGYFLKQGLQSNQDFYYLTILITVTATSEKELDWRVNEMRKLLFSQDIGVYKCTFRQDKAFKSTLPLLDLDSFIFQRSKRNLLTRSAASIYPFASYELSDPSGILLGVNQSNNSMIILDIFNSLVYKNANISIMGTSGAGKTFLIQLMALRMRLKSIQVFIIAPLKGHEFFRASKNIGGEFIRISPASETCINIMEIRKTDNISHELIDEDFIELSKLATKIQSLHVFFALLIPDMNYEEKQLLDEVLIQTYEKKGITHENQSLVLSNSNDEYKEMPILEDVYNLLILKKETKRLANILNRLVHGSARSFNQQTNVDLNNGYTVLDISELTGDLLIIGMFVSLDFVWDKAKEDRTKEKALFIDELWKLIGSSSNTLAAEYVLEIFKIIRGYGGSAICGTQDINDFFALDDGKYGKGIINNSGTKIILKLESEELDRVSSILNLSDTESREISQSERGRGIIATNNNNVLAEFKASKFEQNLITTDRTELQAIARRKKLEKEMQRD